MIDSEIHGAVQVIKFHRPEARNAINAELSAKLGQTFSDFNSNPDVAVAVLYGRGGHFCAGGDLNAIASNGLGGYMSEKNDGPLGLRRMVGTKPVIAAIKGFAVAGGLELAAFCDIRIASEKAIFGVLNRRWGLPLCNGGTVHLPRIIGMGRAMDLILTGRQIDAAEALSMGLVSRVVAAEKVLSVAIETAELIASYPQDALLLDLKNTSDGMTGSRESAWQNEFEVTSAFARTKKNVTGASDFAKGKGRHGRWGGEK